MQADANRREIQEAIPGVAEHDLHGSLRCRRLDAAGGREEGGENPLVDERGAFAVVERVVDPREDAIFDACHVWSS